MPRFEPFRGVRYNAEDGYVDAVIAPPYDVISPDERAALVAREEHNAVRVELPADEGGRSRYEVAAELFQSWLVERSLVRDDEPSFYVYRMGFRDETGRPRQTVGILGALGLEAPGEGILPHERTTTKDKADRLELLRATRVNLSPIWGLSPATGLSALCEVAGPPDLRATDDEGVHHRLWRVTQPGVIAAIREAVASGPVIIADGHHRFEVGNAYRAECGPEAGGHDAILCYVVELNEEQLAVQAIHRLLTDLPGGLDLKAALTPHFDLFDPPHTPEFGEKAGAGAPVSSPGSALLTAMADAGALAVVTRDGTWLARPRPATVAAAEHDLDSSRLDVALATIPGAEVRFQHGADHVIAAVDKGDAQAAVLLRPATVEQIKAIGHGGERMPPKTTFFYPKPRTGMAFRELDPPS